MDNWDISEWSYKPGGLLWGWSYKAGATVVSFCEFIAVKVCWMISHFGSTEMVTPIMWS